MRLRTLDLYGQIVEFCIEDGLLQISSNRFCLTEIPWSPILSISIRYVELFRRSISRGRCSIS